MTKLSDFLDVLLVIFIPWSAVNLTDWFLIRRGRYDVRSFFTPGGVYGRFADLSWIIGFTVAAALYAALTWPARRGSAAPAAAAESEPVAS